ncbi:uncharacterized protein K452DRAFT_172404 [Aplosporella prunicola CBS 121167]|uniref:Transmembrane protein n=1 Tax=Aplosporella prunicola CBS 121167 TaxID=1176127 RepID=A0A6A6AYP0_9PEZI|nr:uncharacterized protein K452DRAFT_172404 [Aplosporella prunicola CBS 121167]KAF2135621.1 hypothetical protein K452DRAFT_172404 [Aplosporella prunicola CBS 121167]
MTYGSWCAEARTMGVRKARTRATRAKTRKPGRRILRILVCVRVCDSVVLVVVLVRGCWLTWVEGGETKEVGFCFLFCFCSAMWMWRLVKVKYLVNCGLWIRIAVRQ